MSLRAADARFLLPNHPRTALVLGPLDRWRAALHDAEIEVLPSSGSAVAPHVTIAPGALLNEAAATGAQSLVLIGGGSTRRLRDLGFSVSRFLQLPRRGDADVFMPLGRSQLSGYVLRNVLAPPTALKRVRNEVVQALAARGRTPGRERVLVIATRSPTEPFLVRAAQRAGAPAAASVLCVRREPKRNVFYLFPDGAVEPSHVLKFMRRDGGPALASHRRGLELVERAGPVLSDHAPRAIADVREGGFDGFVETAVPGTKLSRVLASSSSRTAKTLEIERIAAWCVATVQATARPPEELEPARRWLASNLVPHWIAFGAPPDLADRIPAVRAALQHRDLTSYNVFVSDGGFAAIDWEGAQEAWFPLFDLVYFLADALAIVDRATKSDDGRIEHFAALFRGELDSSRVLFRWIRRAVDAAGVPPEAVGPITTVVWTYFGFAPWATPPGVSPAAVSTLKARVARAWLADPALGPGWSRWGS